MRIWDCFLFFNELDLLEIRLNTLAAALQPGEELIHVLVESRKTFQGADKEPVYAGYQYREGFDRFRDRVYNIVIPEFPKVHFYGNPYSKPIEKIDSWGPEILSREVLHLVLRYAEDNDWVILSDVDEIPDLRQWNRFQDGLFECYQHYYYLNYRDVDYVMSAPLIMRAGHLKGRSLQAARSFRSNLPRIQKAGWHYSYTGGEEAISLKLQAFSHVEYNTPQWTDIDRIRECMSTGRDILHRDALHRYEKVPIDDTFPPYVVEHLERFKHLIKE